MKTLPSIGINQTGSSSSSLTQAKGVVEVRDFEYVYGVEENFNTNIQNLIVKWEEKGGEGGGVEGGEGGSNIGRRRSSDFVFHLQKIVGRLPVSNI